MFSCWDLLSHFGDHDGSCWVMLGHASGHVRSCLVMLAFILSGLVKVFTFLIFSSMFLHFTNVVLVTEGDDYTSYFFLNVSPFQFFYSVT